VDTAGNLFIADRDNDAIRKVDTNGIITTIAGTPTPGGGPPAPGSHPEFDDPAGIAVGPDGNLYVADSNRARIRMIDLTTGVITTVAGRDLDPGYSGDGGPALQARIKNPGGIVFDTAGNMYFADTDNHVVRRIDRHGVITTVVGSGRGGCPVEGEPAVGARLKAPTDVAIGPDGHLYVSDGNCNGVYELVDGTLHVFGPTTPLG
jgi:serine/threonine-protein kinase